MGKAVLHNLIDLLNDADTETIYNVLIRFVPEEIPYEDEILAIEAAEEDIADGNLFDFSSVDWDNI